MSAVQEKGYVRSEWAKSWYILVILEDRQLHGEIDDLFQ